MLSTGLANTALTCSAIEYLHFAPTAANTCAEYMSSYIGTAGGYLLNPNATSDCQYCTVAETNIYLKAFNSNYSLRWRNFGILWAYILFNVAGAIFFYWLARVPSKAKKEKDE
jgi:ATP-binding cassette subfamily G (WHITE) protein 2 (PDR)